MNEYEQNIIKVKNINMNEMNDDVSVILVHEVNMDYTILIIE